MESGSSDLSDFELLHDAALPPTRARVGYDVPPVLSLSEAL